MRTTPRLSSTAVACVAALLVPACTPSPPPIAAEPAAAEHPDLSGVWMAFAVENPDGTGNAPRY
ncbi:MAG TPA: hypothetical protein VGL98_18330, partial [Gammaproteobacteria bacterium]